MLLSHVIVWNSFLLQKNRTYNNSVNVNNKMVIITWWASPHDRWHTWKHQLSVSDAVRVFLTSSSVGSEHSRVQQPDSGCVGDGSLYQCGHNKLWVLLVHFIFLWTDISQEQPSIHPSSPAIIPEPLLVRLDGQKMPWAVIVSKAAAL